MYGMSIKAYWANTVRSTVLLLLVVFEEISHFIHGVFKILKLRKINYPEMVRLFPVEAAAMNKKYLLLTEKIKHELLVICDVETLCADLGAQGEPALAGELDIQKDQVGLNGVYLRECSGEIHHGGGLISLGLEKGDQFPLDGGIVLNDKNFIWHRKTSFLWFAPDQGQIDLACLWLGVLVEGREALPLVKGQRPLVVLIDL